MLQQNLDDVLAAGRVLFGPAFRADGQAWRVELKTTYRRRALETHPDRARSVGRAESDLAAEFRRVAEAYRVLSQQSAGLLPLEADAAEPPPPPPRPQRHPHARPAAPPRTAAPPRPAAKAPEPARAAPAAEPRAHDVPGQRARYSVNPDSLPRRRLRFAEYLYYSGRVPWTAFVESIGWQRRQRPPVGRIAVDWGFLEPEDVPRIMEERRRRGAQAVPFGEFAVRLGYLTSFQILAILGQQLRLQKRIGQFFVERGLIDGDEIDAIRHRILRHNLRWRE
jgi:hypothetical protein